MKNDETNDLNHFGHIIFKYPDFELDPSKTQILDLILYYFIYYVQT